MARNDEWCDFCNEKIKSATVTIYGNYFGVCAHCESLTLGNGELVESKEEQGK